MTAPVVNPNATLIPDKAEVWILLKSALTGSITSKIPGSASADLATLGWEFTGLIDAPKGIPITPSIEVKQYDAFGHPKFRAKLKNGDLKTGFTALEWNSVTRKIVLPGSAPNKIGAPKDVQIYVLYRWVDEDSGLGTTVWVTLTPAPVELTAHGGIVDGELSWAEMIVHHTTDAAGDVFQVVDSLSKQFTIAAGVTAYTATVDGQTTASITTKTAAALQSALRALSTVTALPGDGVTVTGPTGGPLVATFTGTVTTVTAAGTGGTVTVS